MIQVKNYSYYYDKKYDDLLITFNAHTLMRFIIIFILYILRKMIVLLEHRLCILRTGL